MSNRVAVVPASRSTITLLLAATAIDTAVAILAVTRGDNKKLIRILTTASKALKDYVNEANK